MPETWDIGPWVIATVAGPVILALAIAYGISRYRGRRGASDRRSPDYGADPAPMERTDRQDQG